MRIETDRLLLRPFTMADHSQYAAIWAKPEVIRYLPGGEARAGEAEPRAKREIEASMKLWSGPSGYGPWAVVEKATGCLLGHHGVQILPDLDGQTEILYMLDSTAWGRGFATEGAFAARDFAFSELGLDRVIALAMPENAASMHVMDKIGMHRTDGLVEAFGLDLVLYELQRNSWKDASRT